MPTALPLVGIENAYELDIYKKRGTEMSSQGSLRKARFALLSALMLCASLHANATVMTFGTGAAVNSQGYGENGMVITSGSAGDVRDYQGVSIGASGERELLINRNSSAYRFQLASGGLFNLLSLDVEQPAGAYANWSTFDSLLITASNGVSVSLGSTAFGTDLFSTSFNGISWFALSDVSGQAFVDNITFETPEPATNALVLVALGLMGIFAKRRKSA